MTRSDKDRTTLASLLKEELNFSARMFFAPSLAIAREFARQWDYTRHLATARPDNVPANSTRHDISEKAL